MGKRGRKERKQTSALGKDGSAAAQHQAREQSSSNNRERTRTGPASGTSVTYLKRRETHSVLALFSQHTIGSDGKDGLERGTQAMNHCKGGLNALL